MTKAEHEQAVRAVIERSMKAFQVGDLETIDALSSDRPGCITIGTDPDEWWDKPTTMAWIREAMTDPGTMSVGDSSIRAEAGEYTVHVQGEAAWSEGRGKFVNDHRDERAVRNTGVFVREDGEWRCVQAHGSIGVPNHDIFKS
jgi:ketosteroid isomerase-like protein